MKRLLPALWLAVTACQGVEPPTDETSQALDCYGGGSYCGAAVPAPTPWKGYAPPSSWGAKTVFVVVPDAQATGWIAYQADWEYGVIPWAASASDQQLSSMIRILGGKAQLFVQLRPPPPPPPPPGQDRGAYLLELAYRLSQAPIGAEQGAAACKY